MSLIVTGSIGIDTIHAPTGSAVEVPGGSCAYFATAAAIQAPVRIVAAVGGDWPEAHRALLTSVPGLCTLGLEHRPASRTFAWGGRYLPDMNARETLFTELGVLGEPGPRVPDAYRDSRFVFLANSHPTEQARLLDHFPDRAIAIVDTMDLWINIAHGELLGLLRRVDGVVLNDSEATQLTECRNAVSAGRAILGMGPRFAIIKKGEHGCLLIHADGVAALPAFPMEAERVIDPTGAGDSFAGGLMGHLARVGRTDLAAIREGLVRGTVTASFTIESFSLERLRQVRPAEFETRLTEFRRMAEVA
ncbi:MAG: sugar kinase [Phycisphaeraceae bacterium]|nr:sugar kinase [Phycisphaeraceae bacterium]